MLREWGYPLGMSEPAEKLMAESMKLSTSERAALAADLLASLDGEPEEGVEAAWAAEIERRVRRVTCGQAHFEDWVLVREQLRREP